MNITALDNPHPDDSANVWGGNKISITKRWIRGSIWR